MTTNKLPRIPWLFLGGYFLFFIGLVISLIGGFESSGVLKGEGDPLKNFGPVGLVGIGIVCAAGGTLLMARSEQIRGHHMSALIVCFVMTPIPALIGLGINHLGARLRKSANTTVQAILVGFGIFLLVLAADWWRSLQQGGAPREDFQVIAWAPFANLGVIALVLAAVPLIWAKSKADSLGVDDSI